MPASSHVLDRIGVTFDDGHAVANAGLILPATLLAHLGLEAELYPEVVDARSEEEGGVPSRTVKARTPVAAGGEEYA